jgi:hypothetical protein
VREDGQVIVGHELDEVVDGGWDQLVPWRDERSQVWTDVTTANPHLSRGHPAEQALVPSPAGSRLTTSHGSSPVPSDPHAAGEQLPPGQLRARERADTLIGVLWAAGMSLGVVFLDLTPGYAQVAGTPVRAATLLLHLMTAATVVMVTRVVGLVLVIALLTIPTAVAGRMTRRITWLVPAAMLVSLVFIWSGLAISYRLNLTAGATIVLTATAGYAIAAAAGRLVPRLTPSEPG